MKTIRTFIAIPLDEEVRRAAIKMIGKLRDPEDGIKWVPTDNLHLTLKFLGEVENMEVPGACKILRDVCRNHEPFELVFGGASGLPDTERSRVVCASVKDTSQSLTEIVTQLEEDYAEIGFKQEPRDYVPHLTLGRAKGRRANAEVVERVREQAEFELGSMTVDTICVFGSFLEKTGPVYQIMDTIDL